VLKTKMGYKMLKKIDSGSYLVEEIPPAGQFCPEINGLDDQVEWLVIHNPNFYTPIGKWITCRSIDSQIPENLVKYTKDVTIIVHFYEENETHCAQMFDCLRDLTRVLQSNSSANTDDLYLQVLCAVKEVERR
jgi:hypothetical protein